MQKHIREDMLTLDFSSSIHVNRRCFCDANPTHETVIAWEKAAKTYGAGHAHHFMLDHIHWSKGGRPRWAEDDGTPYDVNPLDPNDIHLHDHIKALGLTPKAASPEHMTKLAAARVAHHIPEHMLQLVK